MLVTPGHPYPRMQSIGFILREIQAAVIDVQPLVWSITKKIFIECLNALILLNKSIIT